MSFVCFARFNIFLLNIHVREREELDTSPLSFEFSKSFFTNLRCFGAFVVCFLGVKHFLGLKDRITINIICHTTKFFSALVSLVCFHITAARIKIVILALNICSRLRNQILESMLS
jgi:hypothetical protein